ncbi:MAG: LysR family transcriptional regulator [Deltaproteobacteria bacterium]|nr:LysR family transcriptional regulator [Deltaproteobacteria bacterium]
MNQIDGINLDLNLLRVFAVVADSQTVTAAATKLYLTQSAVSAALRRLTDAIGAPLFVRQGRGITLTARGRALLEQTRPHLDALLAAALHPAGFDPATSTRTFRLGLSDATEGWLLPSLLKVCRREAPHMQLIVLGVQFRTVSEALSAGRVDAAVTVADDLPSTVMRETLFSGGFVCLFDPRHVHVKTKHITLEQYFAEEHVIVSYNGDLRGVVEDVLRQSRKVRCSLPNFATLGLLVQGGPLVATVPAIVAHQIVATHPHLRTSRLPFKLHKTPLELLWPSASNDDPAARFLRGHIAKIARAAERRVASP